MAPVAFRWQEALWVERVKVYGDLQSHLRKIAASYKGILWRENDGLRLENTYFGDENH